MILIIGGSGSGKSQYAEKRALEAAKKNKLPLYYIATMKIRDMEDEEKARKHRRMRKGKGFKTIECPIKINKISESVLKKNSAALLECVSNLTANEMFESGAVTPLFEVTKKVLNEISDLDGALSELVVVADDVSADTMNYDKVTVDYAAALGKINQALAKKADEVVEVVAGIPIRLK